MEYAPYGQFTVQGNDRKRGETIALTLTQREAVNTALDNMLVDCEAAYFHGDVTTDYHLFSGGRLVRGRAVLDRARAGHLTRTPALGKFHELERVAGVTPVPGRGWYGLRRVATDAANDVTGDSRVLNAMGGWSPSSSEREARYQKRGNSRVRAKAAEARDQMRGAAPAGPEAPDAPQPAALPPEVQAALAAAPDAVRSVLAPYVQLMSDVVRQSLTRRRE